ncbi:unnamed protein product [Meganyctiphanes norvegica]|uniref:Uncharacterized protein n=1 Tax=Meganyctiphanes norvegica TaxID=48144 RepID=A0AAV2QCD8_MEGNR
MTESETAGKVRKYVYLKIAQTATCLLLFAIGLFFIWVGTDDDGGYESLDDEEFFDQIYVHIFTWTLLLSAVLAGVAAIILHRGNKNADAGTLKTFLCVGCLTYSLFDKCGGGFPLVRQRIEEIEQGEPLMEENVKV